MPRPVESAGVRRREVRTSCFSGSRRHLVLSTHDRAFRVLRLLQSVRMTLSRTCCILPLAVSLRCEFVKEEILEGGKADCELLVMRRCA